ncbi:serine hydrolase [Halobium salinum]|uniref:Serine hydrolase n=1 Tax=Halobium salinum TaxID=1364940 RepID=A0ABD5P7U0_9EURY|nr:serine hydrolase [Halobium salinum]
MNPSSEATAAVDALCRDVVGSERVPGLSVTVADADGTVYASGYGSRDLAGNRPATADTLYGVGSVTKSMTALAVAQLAEAGMLAVDDPAADHLDADLDGALDHDGEPVRLRHLLSHTSGLPSLGTSETLIGRRLRRSVDTLPMGDREDFYAHLRGAVDERTGPPGERFAYSNAGYVLLGHVVEEATGRPFAEYVEEHLFDPLGMERATFDDFAFSTDDDHATPYLLEEGEPTAASLPVRELSHPAGGALASTADLARYLRLYLGDGDLGGQRHVDSATVGDLLEPRVETPYGPYGFGWWRESVAGHTLNGHAGDVAVSSAYAGFCPEEGVAVAVGANTAPPFPLSRVGHGVFAAVLGENPYEAVPYFRRRALFGDVTGEYAVYRGVKRAVVRRDGGTVRVDFDGPLGGESTPLVPADDAGRTWVEDGEADFEAVDDGGERRPARFVDGEDGPELLFDRWRLHRVSGHVPRESRAERGR